MRKLNIVTLTLFMAGCATGINPQKYNDNPASIGAFKICHGYSCTYKSESGFTSAEWQNITAIFASNPALTTESERSNIAKAIAMMEGFTGAKTGTSEDAGEAETIKTSKYQMDCIDETVNTTQYLTLLQKSGLLKFYAAAEPTHRGYFIDGRWPHNTAEMREISSGDLYVVDSFYRANGEQPYIMSRETWLAGWKPPGSSQ